MRSSFFSRLCTPTTGPVPCGFSAPKLLRTTAYLIAFFLIAERKASLTHSSWARTSGELILGGIIAYTAFAPANALVSAPASVVSATNPSAPFCVNRSKCLGLRPTTRTFSACASNLSATTLPVFPVAPVMTYMASSSPAIPANPFLLLVDARPASADAAADSRIIYATLVPLGQPEKAMDHESPMEPWLAPDNLTACWSQNKLASSPRCDENRW